MVKSINGKRDLGSGEVCRYLLSEPCYHSDFSPVYLHLNFNHRQLDLSRSTDVDQPLSFKKSLLDYFANRNNIELIVPHLHKISNLIDFARNFEIMSDRLRIRKNSNKTVIITFPKIRLVKKNPKLLLSVYKICSMDKR